MNDAAVPGTATAGQMLRAARDRLGLHQAVLAASLKVPPRKLELLETDRYDELPDATFVRALALSMCRALKIDATPVLAKLPQSAGHGLEQVARGLNQPFRDHEDRGESAEWSRRISVPVVMALLLVLAALAVWFWPGQGPVSAGPVIPSVSDVPSVVAPPLASAAPPAPAEASAPPAAPAATSTAPGPVAETVFSVPAAAAGASSPAGHLLSLRATEESWVEVVDRGGQLLLSRNLAPGEMLGLDGVPPLRVTIGNAAATSLSFRGKPVPLTASIRDNIARVELR